MTTPIGKRGPLGISITEAERIAPKGQYRAILADMAGVLHNGTYRVYFVGDFPNYRDALKAAKAARTAGDIHVGFAVHDDTGQALDPAPYRARPSGFPKYFERERAILAA